MSFAQNRFDALLGDEDTEVDKLGNVKPKEKKDADKPPTRRDVRRNGQRQPAVSPPSRRDRGNRKEEDSLQSEPQSEQQSSSRPPRERFGGEKSRGRQFDRHSGTGIHDNEKKIRQGWGEPGEAEYQGAHDTLNSNDPDAPEETRRFGNQEAEDNTKTLEEYLADRKSKPLQLPEVRKANEGSNDSQWKESVVLEKEEDSYFVGKSHEQKSKNKVKKEKIFIDIEQPPHRSQNDRRDGGGRGRGRGRGRGTRGGRGGRGGRAQDYQGSVNLSDSSAFPNLGA